MDLTNMKSLTLGGVPLKQLLVNGVQVWAEAKENLFNGKFSNKTLNGVTFSWDDENKILTLNGTATAAISSYALYGTTDLSLPVGTYKWEVNTVGGSYTYETYTWFRFGNTSSGTTKYMVNLDTPKTVTQTVEVNAFAPRITAGTVFNNLQLQIIVTQ